MCTSQPISTRRFVVLLVFGGYLGLPLVWGPAFLAAASTGTPAALRWLAPSYSLLFALGQAAALDAAFRKKATGREFLAWSLLPTAVALVLLYPIVQNCRQAELGILSVPLLIFCQHLVLAYPIVVQQNLRARNLDHSAPEHHVGLLSALLVIAGVLPNLLVVGLTLVGISGQQDAFGWALLACACVAAAVGPTIGYRRFFADRMRHDAQRLSLAGRLGVVCQTLWQMRLSLAIFVVTGCVAVYTVLLHLVSDG